jgi:hypothetical protein
MNTRIAQANRLVAEYRFTEMDESGLSVEEQVQVLVRELGVSREAAVGFREDWAGLSRPPGSDPDPLRHRQLSESPRPG